VQVTTLGLYLILL